MDFLAAAGDAAESASGSSDLTVAAVGLVGAIIGAGVGLIGVWRQSRTAERSAYRRELREHYAAFMRQWEVLQLARDTVGYARDGKKHSDDLSVEDLDIEAKDLEAVEAGVQELTDDQRDKAKRLLRAKIAASEELIAANQTYVEASRRIATLANEFILIAPHHVGEAAWTLISERSDSYNYKLVLFITTAVRAEIGRTAKDRWIWTRVVASTQKKAWFKQVMAASGSTEAGAGSTDSTPTS